MVNSKCMSEPFVRFVAAVISYDTPPASPTAPPPPAITARSRNLPFTPLTTVALTIHP